MQKIKKRNNHPAAAITAAASFPAWGGFLAATKLWYNVPTFARLTLRKILYDEPALAALRQALAN